MNINPTNLKIEELDIHEIGIWPLQYRVVVIILLSIAVLALAYLFILKNSINKLISTENDIKSSINTFAETFQQSSNLDLYKKQMIKIEGDLKNLLKKLPTKGELPSLLEDISQQALSAGLVFQLIKPEDPIDKGFYFEQPIKIIITGKYHGFGKFAAGIAALPRIVTLHDFSIRSEEKNNNQQDQGSELIIETQAKTYWYADKGKL